MKLLASQTGLTKAEEEAANKWMVELARFFAAKCNKPTHPFRWVQLRINSAPCNGWDDPDRPPEAGAFAVLDAFWGGQHLGSEAESMRHVIQSDWRIFGLDKDQDIRDMRDGMADWYEAATTRRQ